MTNNNLRYVYTLGIGPIYWKLNIQPIIALPTTKVEYMVLAEATKKIIYHRGLVNELDIHQCGVTLH